MSSVEITPLDVKKDKQNIIEIFSTAFGNYPLTQFFFFDAYKQSIKHLIEWICDETSIVDNLFLGAFVEAKLQGFAFITPPPKPENYYHIESTTASSQKKLAKAIGEPALMRMEAYSNLKYANKPLSPHFYINALAVAPRTQGKGIGSALLSKVHQISEDDPKSCGVALDTQTQQNVSYYQRFGYGIYSTIELEHVNNWFMFRPSLDLYRIYHNFNKG